MLLIKGFFITWIARWARDVYYLPCIWIIFHTVQLMNSIQEKMRWQLFHMKFCCEMCWSFLLSALKNDNRIAMKREEFLKDIRVCVGLFTEHWLNTYQFYVFEILSVTNNTNGDIEVETLLVISPDPTSQKSYWTESSSFNTLC